MSSNDGYVDQGTETKRDTFLDSDLVNRIRQKLRDKACGNVQESGSGTTKRKLDTDEKPIMCKCTCIRNLKTIAFRTLINQISDENLDVFWEEVVEIINKYSEYEG